MANSTCFDDAYGRSRVNPNTPSATCRRPKPTDKGSPTLSGIVYRAGPIPVTQAESDRDRMPAVWWVSGP